MDKLKRKLKNYEDNKEIKQVKEVKAWWDIDDK